MSPTANPNRRSDVETYILPDATALLYDPAADTAHPLDVVMALIWEYCDGQLSADGIAHEIAALLPQAPDAVAHTLAILDEFARVGLLAPPMPVPEEASAT